MTNEEPRQTLTKEELAAGIIFKTIESISGVFHLVIRCGTIAFGIYALMVSVRHVAGRETSVSVILGAFIDLSIGRPGTVLAWAVNAVLVAAIVHQRRLGRRLIKRVSKRMAELELLIDPDRSSSALEPTGETNRRDLP